MSEQSKDLPEQKPELEGAVLPDSSEVVEPLSPERETSGAPVDGSPEQQVVPAAAISVGAALRAAREELKLSLGDVSGRIKFTEKQIIALETDDYDSLPEGAFLRGLVRSYARALQLDEARLIEALPQPAEPVVEAKIEPAPTRLKAPRPELSSRTKLVIGMVSGLAVVSLIALNLPKHAEAPQSESNEIALPLPASAVEVEPTASAVPAASEVTETMPVPSPDVAVASAPVAAPTPVVVPAPVPPSPVKPVPVPLAQEVTAAKPSVVPVAPQPPAAVVESKPDAVAANAGVRLVFDDMSWTEVRDGKGKVLLSQRNHPGTEKILSGTPPYNLVVGNAKSVHVYFHGKPVELNLDPSHNVARLKLE